MDKKISEKISKIEHDIELIKIQGATNVALATLDGMLIATEQKESEDILKDIEEVGFRLSNARINEPLARNAVKFVLGYVKKDNESHIKTSVRNAISEFKSILKESKLKMKDVAVETLKDVPVVLTHCHSSTTESALVALSKANENFKVVATETRPLFQGRITAKNLLKQGVDVYMIVDSASASFIVQDQYLVVDTTLVGCDELLVNGDIVNKIGTFSLALASNAVGDKIYVMTTLLKLDLDRDEFTPDIELRPAKEIWPDAPKDLKLINPSFDLIPSNLISGYITEAGLLTKEQLKHKAKMLYEWL